MRVNLRSQGLGGGQFNQSASTQSSAPFVLEGETVPTADQLSQSRLQVWQGVHRLGNLDHVSPHSLQSFSGTQFSLCPADRCSDVMENHHTNQLSVDFTQYPLTQTTGDAIQFGFAFPQPEKQFNGIITNDKFCLTRRDKLQLSWWRRPLRLRG
jgi:hypothetical protein